MDIIKPKKSNVRARILYGSMTLMAICITYYLMLNSFGIPSLDKDKIRIAEVKSGRFDVTVSGNGLVTAMDPEWAVAQVSGQVINVNVKSGNWVEKGDVLVEMLNEEVSSDFARIESDLRAEQADFSLLRVNLETQRAEMNAEYLLAKLNFKQSRAVYEAMKKLSDRGIAPAAELEFVEAKVKAEKMEGMMNIAKLRLDNLKKIEDARVQSAEYRLSSIEKEAARLKNRLESLLIRASASGEVQDIKLKVGQNVAAGDAVAKIVDPSSSYVTLSVPATQAYKISRGNKVEVKLNKTPVYGYVNRIDPNVKGTTVDLDVYFDDVLPESKVGMFVNGAVYTDSFDSTLFVEIPSNPVENGDMSVFVVSEDGEEAQLGLVKTGVQSSNYLQIVGGINKGQKIIVSDMSARSGDKFRLN